MWAEPARRAAFIAERSGPAAPALLILVELAELENTTRRSTRLEAPWVALARCRFRPLQSRFRSWRRELDAGGLLRRAVLRRRRARSRHSVVATLRPGFVHLRELAAR